MRKFVAKVDHTKISSSVNSESHFPTAQVIFIYGCYVTSQFAISEDHLDELVIPPGQVFCLGDNRDQSQDSRVFGPVPRSTLRGRAMLIYWSFDGSGRETARGLERLLYLPLNFVGKTRWERQFTLVR